MDFVNLGIGKEDSCVLVSQIGNWTVTKQHCDTCGMDHYKLEVYDKKGISLCSIVGNKTDIEKRSKKIKNAMQHLRLPKIRKKIEVAKPIDIRLSIQRNNRTASPVGGVPVGGAPVGGAPVGGAPVGGAPVGSAPVGSAPVGSAPVGSAPVGAPATVSGDMV